MSQPVGTARRPKHLLDPDDPRPQRGDQASLTRVQRWVMSALAVTTILHLAAGLALAAYFSDAGRIDARVGLNVLAGVLGVLAVSAGFLIHGRNPLALRRAPWLLFGVVPGVVGLAATFLLG